MKPIEFINEAIRKHLFANCRSISEFERLDKLGEGTYFNFVNEAMEQFMQQRIKKLIKWLPLKKLRFMTTMKGFQLHA